MARVAGEFCILREHPTRVAGLRLLPLGETGFEFSCRNAQRDRALLGVDGDGIAVLDDGNGTAEVLCRNIDSGKLWLPYRW